MEKRQDIIPGTPMTFTAIGDEPKSNVLIYIGSGPPIIYLCCRRSQGR